MLDDMNDQNPTQDQENTQHLPGDSNTHRYGSAASTQQRPEGPQGPPPPPYGFGNQGNQPGGFPGGAPRRERPRPSGAFTATLLVAALVLGAFGGLAGAAGFAAVDYLNGGAGTATSSERSESAQSAVSQEPDTPAEPGSVQEVADSVLPSVVKINVRGPQGQGSGSGIILSRDGEILTNNHVVAVAADGGSVSVSFNDGSTAPAEVVGTDPLTDLAVIQARDVSGLTPATLGSSGNLDVGEQVVAIGSPFGLEATVTSGIVSALNRPVSVGEPGPGVTDTTYPAVQTDAAINPGNSGGPLVNMDGEVVGVNSSIRTASSASGGAGSIGLGFAIPLDKVLPIVDQLRAGETPTHARLGVRVTDAQGENGLLSGAGIASVGEGSAAEEAGLERGDVVTKVNGELITGSASLVATIRGFRPGDQVSLTVVRDGEEQEVDVTLDSDEGSPAS